MTDEDRVRLELAQKRVEMLEAEVIAVLRKVTDPIVGEVVADLRLRENWGMYVVPRGTWEEIGEVLGVSRQAAQQRFGGYVSLVEDQLIGSLTTGRTTKEGGSDAG